MYSCRDTSFSIRHTPDRTGRYIHNIMLTTFNRHRTGFHHKGWILCYQNKIIIHNIWIFYSLGNKIPLLLLFADSLKIATVTQLAIERVPHYSNIAYTTANRHFDNSICLSCKLPAFGLLLDIDVVALCYLHPIPFNAICFISPSVRKTTRLQKAS